VILLFLLSNYQKKEAFMKTIHLPEYIRPGVKFNFAYNNMAISTKTGVLFAFDKSGLKIKKEPYKTDGKVGANQLYFFPQTWGGLDVYMAFSGDFKKKKTKVYLAGIYSHMIKAHQYWRDACEQVKEVEHDYDELNTTGSSTFKSMSNFTRHVETSLTSLVSAVDALKSFLCLLFLSNSRADEFERNGVLGFYKTAHENSKSMCAAGIPSNIVDILHDYFPILKNWNTFRNNIAHGIAGHSAFKRETGEICYSSGEYCIENMEKEFDYFFRFTNVYLLGGVFFTLNSMLEPSPKTILCSFVDGRVYTRKVSPSNDIQFADGFCCQKNDMGKGVIPMCPLSDKCEAYKRS
jgi:hypothetical protein